MSDEIFDAVEMELTITPKERATVMDRLRRTGNVNRDGSVSQHYWIRFCREEINKRRYATGAAEGPDEVEEQGGAKRSTLNPSPDSTKEEA